MKRLHLNIHVKMTKDNHRCTTKKIPKLKVLAIQSPSSPTLSSLHQPQPYSPDHNRKPTKHSPQNYPRKMYQTRPESRKHGFSSGNRIPKPVVDYSHIVHPHVHVSITIDDQKHLP